MIFSKMDLNQLIEEAQKRIKKNSTPPIKDIK
jgi:hypothetical protein